ncbi:hypothetical protein [Aeoliella sp. SH292]|uniref:hypothetical protein n=1 Tax=Aeoliella sp. SH292 TaxID=3454464 RepID=UPI003F972BBB
MKNPYEGSQAIAEEARVPLTSFQRFRRQVLRGATFGAVALGGLILIILLLTQGAPERSNAHELLLKLRAWSDKYAFGVSPLIVAPLLYAVIGAPFGAVLGAVYHVIAQLARLVLRR